MMAVRPSSDELASPSADGESMARSVVVVVVGWSGIFPIFFGNIGALK